MAGSNRKKARKPKTSKHEHGGGGKVTLTPLAKILMNKGAYQTINKSGTKRARLILAAKGHGEVETKKQRQERKGSARSSV